MLDPAEAWPSKNAHSRKYKELASRVAHRLQEAGYHALALSLTVTTTDRREYSAGGSVKPASSDVELLRCQAGRLLGKLSFEAEVTALTLTAYPLREWQHGAPQLSLLDVAVSLQSKGQ